MSEHCSDCSGPRYLTSFGRRSFIQVGMLGGFGLSLADLLRAGEVRPATGGPKRPEGRAKSVIQIILPGGLAHQESWDPKPESPIDDLRPARVVHTQIPSVVLPLSMRRPSQLASR